MKQLEEVITRLHKRAKTSGQLSTTDKQYNNDQSILSQVSSPLVPDRDGPLLHETPVANRASEAEMVTNRTLRTPTCVVHPQELEHTALPRMIAMKPRREGLVRSATDPTGGVILLENIVLVLSFRSDHPLFVPICTSPGFLIFLPRAPLSPQLFVLSLLRSTYFYLCSLPFCKPYGLAVTNVGNIVATYI